MRQRPESLPPRPFYEALESARAASHRLLLISYVFPPAQASGSLRWQKLSHFVAERGCALDVVTLDPSCLDSPDLERLADLAPGTRVYGVPAPSLPIGELVRAAWGLYRGLRARLRRVRMGSAASESASGGSVAEARPGSFARKEVRWSLGSPRGFIRAYSVWFESAFSDRWARAAAALAERLIEPGVHTAIITSGPPHTAYEAGRRLSRATGLPFVMDMRDPWSLAERLLEYVATPLWLRLAARGERRAVSQAALVVTNTEPFRVAMCRVYPEAAHRVITVMNGSDEGPLPPSRQDERFLIAYAGAIYLDRDPRLVFRAVARLIAEFELTPQAIGLELIGHVDRYGAVPVSDIAREEGLSEFVRIQPPRPHRAALEFLARATVLVSLPQDNDLAIPAKIFEYVRFDAWVLVMATPESATGLLLRDSGADVVAPDDLEEIVRTLRMRFLQHRRGIRPTRVATDGRFSRRVQAELLLDAIESLGTRDPLHAPISSGART
jgi:glycosyltransferase involved in cell wall biosynthesis